MKKIIFVNIISLFIISFSQAKVNSSNLSYWYDGCIKGAIKTNQYNEGVKICTCAVDVMNQKLTNYEFENIFINERYKADKWMAENIVPVCYNQKN